MESKETYQILKLISQKLKIVISVSGSLIVVFAMFVFFAPSCSTQYIQIMSEIQNYESNLDPELCDSLMEKISMFENSCHTDIEPLDCG